MDNYLKFNSLNESVRSKWEKKIRDAITEIKKSPSGNILISELKKYNFEINSECKISYITRYSKLTFFDKDKVRIIVPINEKIRKIRTFRENGIDNSYDKTPDLHVKICNNSDDITIDDLNKEKNDQQSSRTSIIKFGFIENTQFYTILANIFIHALQYFLDPKEIPDDYNHCNIIHGIKGKTLYIRNHKITENQIRKELGLNYRINASDTYNI